MEHKKKLGQFYTTNYKYILQNLFIPEDVLIIEPFAGKGDLLYFVGNKVVECLDIDPQKENIEQRDTLLNPPVYKNKFVLTNPPYLARNKSKEKVIFDKYDQNDLYKCFMSGLITNVCIGGILIIPLNFWCSVRKIDIELRASFLERYDILTINIFEEQVFEDTSYTICSFQFEKKGKTKKRTDCFVYPGNKKIPFELNKANNFTIGGEIYNLPQNTSIRVSRLTKNNKDSEYKTNILAKCIDDTNTIGLSFVKDVYVDMTPKASARSYATLVIQPKLTISQQKKLIKRFNDYLHKKRDLYHSLFLTNYREKRRKRISFRLVFQIVNYLLDEIGIF